MQERRKTRRLQRGEATFLEYPSGKKATTLLDISIGGMRVELDEEFKVGTPLMLKASILPHAGEFFMAGRVTWVKKNAIGAFETGVKFTKVSTIPL